MERTRPNPAEIYAKAPDKYVTIVHQREGDMARTYDGRDAVGGAAAHGVPENTD